jgi:hypothetical protein
VIIIFIVSFEQSPEPQIFWVFGLGFGFFTQPNTQTLKTQKTQPNTQTLKTQKTQNPTQIKRFFRVGKLKKTNFKG